MNPLHGLLLGKLLFIVAMLGALLYKTSIQQSIRIDEISNESLTLSAQQDCIIRTINLEGHQSDTVIILENMAFNSGIKDNSKLVNIDDLIKYRNLFEQKRAEYFNRKYSLIKLNEIRDQLARMEYDYVHQIPQVKKSSGETKFILNDQFIKYQIESTFVAGDTVLKNQTLGILSESVPTDELRLRYYDNNMLPIEPDSQIKIFGDGEAYDAEISSIDTSKKLLIARVTSPKQPSNVESLRYEAEDRISLIQILVGN